MDSQPCPGTGKAIDARWTGASVAVWRRLQPVFYKHLFLCRFFVPARRQAAEKDVKTGDTNADLLAGGGAMVSVFC
jgi:hypothetical protein